MTRRASQPMWALRPTHERTPPLTLYSVAYTILAAILLAQVLAGIATARAVVDASCTAHGCEWRAEPVERGEFVP